jgi:ribokinase
VIVVFGSINVDLVLRVDAFPRSGETVLSDSYRVHPGGKGANAAVAAARAGGETQMIGRVGGDLFAENALRIMRDAGVGLDCVAESQRPTGCATIWVDRRGENAIVVASGANLDVAAGQVPDSLLGDGTLVALQMEVPPAENWHLMERAKKAGARVLLNLAPAYPVPAHALDSIDVLVVNQAEAAALASSSGLKADQASDTAHRLAKRYGMTCVVTLGRDGALAFGPTGDWQIPALPIDAVDTTGAGDAFCGGLAAALDRGLDMETALRCASVGAALACTVEGAQSSLPGRKAIEARLDELPGLQRIS